MDKQGDLSDEQIKAFFPLLRDDPAYKRTSHADPNYNCIAWAFKNSKDKWIQYDANSEILEGVFCWWPPKIEKTPYVSSYIELFKSIGFELCNDCKHEDGYIKIALYENIDNHTCSHAARELRNGYWTSKLGCGNDIQHLNPYTIENGIYGKVACFLKKLFE